MPTKKYSSPWWSKPGAVYFIGAGRPVTAVKIGVTQKDKLKQRLRAIQCANHEPVELLGVMLFETGPKPLLDAERQEQSLHLRFAQHQRIVNGNVGHEWFTASAELFDFIAENTKRPEEIGAPRSLAKLPNSSVGT